MQQQQQQQQLAAAQLQTPHLVDGKLIPARVAARVLQCKQAGVQCLVRNPSDQLTAGNAVWF